MKPLMRIRLKLAAHIVLPNGALTMSRETPYSCLGTFIQLMKCNTAMVFGSDDPNLEDDHTSSP